MTGATPDTSTDALDQTIGALDAGLTGIQPSTARSLIAHWQTECANAQDAKLGEVSAGLGALGDALSGDRLDGRTIGAALRSLSESTLASASGDARLQPRLIRLSALLARGARMLGA